MATYYIAAGGSTGNSGTLPNSPWPLSQIGAGGATFAAGDVILFNRGDKLTGVTTFTYSGSSGNPITFDFYGSAANNPILDGGGSSSNVLKITGNYITINNLVFQNCTAWNGVILLNTGVHDIVINNCYINSGIRGILAYQCGSAGVANIKISSCFFSNISDPSFATGGGNYVQFNAVNGSGCEIAYNKGYTDVSTAQPYVGDLISMFQSNGTSSSYILIHDNWLRGGGNLGGPGIGGKCGIGLGDTGGSYQNAYNNILVNTGYAGVQIAGGNNIICTNNRIFSNSYTYSLIALSVFSTGVPPTSITASNNFLNWRDYNNHVDNLNLQPGVTTPTGWSTNTPSSTADPYAYDSLLPNPLFQQGDWNIYPITGDILVTTPPPTYVTGGMQTVIRNFTTGRLESLLGNYLPNASGTDAAYTINLNNGDFVFLPAITAARTVTFPLVVDGKVIIVFNQNSSAFAWSINSAPAVKTASLSTVTSITNQTITMYIGSATALAWLKMF